MTLFIISLVSLGAFAQYGPPSTSGPGITVLSGEQSFRTANFNGGDNQMLCEDASGLWWKPGSRIQNTNINQIATCESSGQWDYQQTCPMANRGYCWTNCAHNFSPDCTSACRCLGSLGASRTATRLGAAGLPTADETKSTQKMGGGWNTQCPTYAPYNGDYCSTSGLFCQYPNLNQNYICKSNKWSLQTAPGKKSCTKWGQTFKDGYQYLGQYGCYEWSCKDGKIVYNTNCGPYTTTTEAPYTTTSPKKCWVWKGWYWSYDWSCWSPWSSWSTESN